VMRSSAVDELPGRLLRLAATHGLEVARVTVRNQRSRWGSCSRDGTIALNWRLLQMPTTVCDYVLLHELMHLREPNHSPRFWAQVASVCPDYAQARAWLRVEGLALC
jgi:predicted metal-dependent hydrolase